MLVVVLLVVADRRLALPLLYCFCVISPLLSLSCLLSPILPPLSLSFGLPIYRKKKTEQVCLLLVRLQSRNGWSAIDAFGCGGGEEREAGRFFKNGFCLLSLFKRGEGGR